MGKEAEKGVSSGIEILSVEGLYGNTGHDVEHFELDVRLAAGSDTVNFNSTIILFDTPDTTQNIDYNATSTEFPESTNTFHIEYLQTGPDYEAGYLSRGDVVRIRFNHYDAESATDADGGLGQHEEGRLQIILPKGTAAIAEFKTAVIVRRRERLWPG